MIATQRIQVGIILACKIVAVTADHNCFTASIDGKTIATVPRTTTRDIHRYKARAVQRPASKPPGYTPG
jgi:hypothetical protein